ncbi:MAG: efflux transporter outer membrane subunit [Rhodanobacteraceae bacterium]
MRWAFAIASSAWLAGCAGVAVPSLPHGDLPAAWRNAENARKAPAPDLRSWWRAYHDPALNALVASALRDNLDVQQAALRVRAARALADASGAAYKPQLDFRTLSTPTPQATANYFQAGFDAEWELGLFGRAQASEHISAAQTDTAEAELQAARVSLVAEVVRAYLQLRGAQQREALANDAAQAMQRKFALTQVRERLRLASGLEVERAKADAASADGALSGPRAEIAQAAQTIALLLGRNTPPSDVLAAKPLPELAQSGLDALPADMLRTRPEIAQAQANVLKAAGELGLAHADRFPRIGLGGAITAAARVSGISLGHVNSTAGIGPEIDIPLFDWGMRAAAEHARDDELKAALLAYRQTVLQGASEVESSLAALHQTRLHAAQTRVAVASLQRGETMTATLRKLGQADGMDMVDARLALAKARLENEQAQEAQDIAYVALYKALGGAPLPDEAPAAATSPATNAMTDSR